MFSLFKYLINLSPVLNFSNDSSFGSLKNFHDFRVSIFAFHSGSVIHHILSFSISREHPFYFKFSFVKLVRLEDIYHYRNGAEEEKFEFFKNELDGKDPDQIDIITEFLKEKVAAAREPLSVLNDKIIANLSILTASAAFVGYLFSESVKVSMTKWHLAFLFITLLLLSQAFCVIFDGIKTRSTSKSTVKGIVENSTKRAVAESLYFDLLFTLRTSNQLATNVLNARKFLMSLFLSMTILFFMVSLGGSLSANLTDGRGGSGIYLKSDSLDIDTVVLFTKEIKDYRKVLVLCRAENLKCASLAEYLILIGKDVHLSRVEESFINDNSIFISEVI